MKVFKSYQTNTLLKGQLPAAFKILYIEFEYIRAPEKGAIYERKRGAKKKKRNKIVFRKVFFFFLFFFSVLSKGFYSKDQ